jgi:hypothetical protein
MGALKRPASCGESVKLVENGHSQIVRPASTRFVGGAKNTAIIAPSVVSLTMNRREAFGSQRLLLKRDSK